MKPPYTITPAILDLCTDIGLVLGQYAGLLAPKPQPRLRKSNRVRTIQGSVSIEGNVLDLEQVTAVLDGKRVVGPKKDIQEVQNCILAYEKIASWQPYSSISFRSAHATMMKGLVKDAGHFRRGNVGVLQGERVAHVAPQAKMVPELIDNLFEYLKSKKENNALIKSCIAHYEIEFIHPFSDGNGRMGRLWQQLILFNYNRVFEYVPVESVIYERQDAYYQSLALADRNGTLEPFLEFSLAAISDALRDFLKQLKPRSQTGSDRLEIAKEKFAKREFSRKDYLELFKTVSTATASRDLQYGVDQKFLRRIGEKRVAKYKFV